MASKLILEVLTQVQGAKDLEGLGQRFQRTGLNLTKFVTAPLVGVGVAAVKVASDAQKADAKLGAAFKSMGASAFTSIDALNQHATALANATTFDDDQIKEAQAVLLTFGNVTGETFDRTTNLAADMSEALGQDLQSSVIQLGKALNDPVKGITALSRVGVSFTQQQRDQVKALVESGDALGAQNLILGEVERQFKGVAEAVGATDAGQAQEAFQQLGEALEQVGTIILPFVSKAAGFLKDLAVGFQNLDPGIQGFIVTVGGLAAALGPVIFGIGKLVGAFKGVIAVFNLLKIALLTNPFTALALAVAAIAFLIITNWDKIWAFLKKTWEAITHALGGVVKFFTDAWDGLVKATTGAWDAVAGIIRGAINGVIDVINGLFSFLNGIQIGIPSVDVGPVHIGGGVIDPFNIGLIPHLASGGIIDRPTLALLGESGPEAVVPLGKGPVGETHFHSHIEVRGEDPFIRNEADLIRANQRVAFLAGF